MKSRITLHLTIIPLLALLLGTSALTAQTILYSEDFNDCALPANWTVDFVGNSNPDWYVGMPQNGNSDGSTVDGSCMLIIDDDATGQNTPPFAIQLTTPTFNGNGFQQVQLSIDVHFRSYEESSLKLFVFDGSDLHELTTWQGYGDMTGEQFSEYETYTADISYFASDQMSIMIQYDDGGTWAWWAGVDNITITGMGSGTNVVAEAFNGCALPSGWSTSVVEGANDWQFGYIDDNGNAWASNSMNGSCFVYFDDDGIGSDAPFSTVRLYSPVFDGTAFANFKLQFDLIFRRYADQEHVAIYVFDGVEHHLVESYYQNVAGDQFNNYQTIQLDLSEYRSEQMQVVFHYHDGNDWGWWVGLDNVKITGSGSINDLCTNAIAVTTGSNCLPANNHTAIFTGDPSACFDDHVGSLWYQYTAGFNGILKIETDADFNDLITIYQGNCNAMTELDCNNRDEHGFTGETHHMTVTSGTEYLFRVSGIESTFGQPRGDLCFSLQQVNAFPAVPPNDICSNATNLVVDDPNCVEGSNLNAGFHGPEPSLNHKSRADIWYHFVATSDQLQVTTQADFADVIAVYSGDCNALTEFAVNDFGQQLDLEGLTTGATYYVQLSGFFATVEGDACIRVATPDDMVASNDLCPDASFVEVDAGCVFGENTVAGFDGPVPGCVAFSTSNIWFEFAAPASGGVQINTGSTFPHVVAIYEGTCDSLTEIYCLENPTYCQGYFEVPELTPGDNYYMQIASAENEFGYLYGDLCLNILDIESIDFFEPLDLVVNVECIGAGVSVLEVVGIGGEGSYTVLGNQTGDTLLTGDTYFTVLSDELGCEVSMIGTVDCGEQPCAVDALLGFEPVSCYSDNDGAASFENGDAYSIIWSTGSTGNSVSNLTAGSYSVTVEDGNACSTVYYFIITEPPALSANATATGETMEGADDGTASASPLGGTPPYSYLWSNGTTTDALTGLAPGEYVVTITDDQGCTIEATVTVNSFECAIGVSISSQDVSCFGYTNGEASASVSNGVPPFTFSWSNGDTGPIVQNLDVGNYTVTAEDANGCPSTANFSIGQPAELIGDIESSNNVTCFNTATGSAIVSADGGTLPYEFIWPGGVTGAGQSNLPAGEYHVTVSDAAGCTDEVVVVVIQPDELQLSVADVEHVGCFGGADGAATVFAEGGTPTPGYSYEWDDPAGQTTATASNLMAGTYTVTVTDNNSCTAVIEAIVGEPAMLVAVVDNVVSEVGAMGNGSIEITMFGGTLPYSFSWELGGAFYSDEEDLYDLSAGSYTLIVTDANGCTSTSTVVVESMVSVQDPVLEKAVRLLPNPTDGKFEVVFDLDKPTPVQIQIFDLLGRQLLLTEREIVETATYPFDLSDLPTGVYPIRIYFDGEVTVRQLVLAGKE